MRGKEGGGGGGVPVGMLTLILVSFWPLSSGAEASGMNFSSSRDKAKTNRKDTIARWNPRASDAIMVFVQRPASALMRTLLISSAETSSSGLKVCSGFTL